MQLNRTLNLLLGICLAVLLSACSSTSGIRVTKGDTTIGEPNRGTIIASNDASVVHVDLFERIATIRNGSQLPSGFLIAKNKKGEQTAALKARPIRESKLRTADILEGEPTINDIITIANATESERLDKIYRDADTK